MITKDSKILILVPHADDEVLGCGGLIAYAKELGAKVYLSVVFAAGFESLKMGTSTDDMRLREFFAFIREAQIDGYSIMNIGTDKHLMLDTVPQKDIIAWLENNETTGFLKLRPDIVLLPGPHSHQDHKAVNAAGLAMLRSNDKRGDHQFIVMEYETPGTGQIGFDDFRPNFYLQLSAAHIQKKADWLDIYDSQKTGRLHWRTFRALRRISEYRGVEIGCDNAEAYRILRIVQYYNYTENA